MYEFIAEALQNISLSFKMSKSKQWFSFHFLIFDLFPILLNIFSKQQPPHFIFSALFLCGQQKFDIYVSLFKQTQTWNVAVLFRFILYRNSELVCRGLFGDFFFFFYKILISWMGSTLFKHVNGIRCFDFLMAFFFFVCVCVVQVKKDLKW